MKIFFITALLVLTVAGCSTWSEPSSRSTSAPDDVQKPAGRGGTSHGVIKD